MNDFFFKNRSFEYKFNPDRNRFSLRQKFRHESQVLYGNLMIVTGSFEKGEKNSLLNLSYKSHYISIISLIVLSILALSFGIIAILTNILFLAISVFCGLVISIIALLNASRTTGKKEEYYKLIESVIRDE